MRVKGLFFAALLSAASITVPAGMTAPAIACGARTMVWTFTIESRWDKKIYERGGIVTQRIKVTRPGPHDPLNNGIPLDSPANVPAEGVTVSTNLFAGYPFPWGVGETDADGKVTLKIKLPKTAKPRFPTSTVATQIHNENGPACSDVEETGEYYSVVRTKG